MSGPPRNALEQVRRRPRRPRHEQGVRHEPIPARVALEPRPADLGDPGPDGGRHDRRQRVVGEIARAVDQLAADRPPRPFGVRLDAQAVGGDLGPDVVRAPLRVAVELDLEERPADVEHDRAVAARAAPRAAPRPRPASGAARPARRRPSRGRRPCPRDRRRSPPGSRGRPAASGWRPCAARGRSRGAARARLPRLALRVRREDPRRPRRPGPGRRLVRRPGAHPERERDRDRRPAGPRQDVVRDPEVARIRPERRPGSASLSVEQPVRRHEPRRAVARRPRPRTSSPTARSGPARRPTATRRGSRGASPRATRPARPERDARWPRSASRASAQRAALARSSRRYGLPSPPSPSTTRQTGSSASNRVRRAPAVVLGGEAAEDRRAIDRLADRTAATPAASP